MPPEGPEPSAPDPALSHLYNLSDRIAIEIVVVAPDWCAIASDATELSELAEARCQRWPTARP